jgi:hypothetical protein
MMFMTGLNQVPTQAMSVGGIRRWKDGRNMPDVHAVQFYYGDLPVAEVAQAMGCAEGTAKALLHAARRNLAGALRMHEEREAR